MKVIKFYKNGCAPCNSVGQILESNNVPVENVNIYDDPDAAFDRNIMSVPVTILLDDAGEEVSRVVGLDIAGLQKLVEAYKQ
jgi:thioredoxin 1